MASLIHPLTRLSANLESTTARDKLMRLIMYTAKLVALGFLRRAGGVLPKKGTEGALLLAKCDTVAKAMAEGRRLFRQGKWLPMLPTMILPAIDEYLAELGKHLSVKTLFSRKGLMALNRIFLFAYLFIDQFVWLGKVGAIKVNADALAVHALRFWGLSVVCLLLANLLARRERRSQGTPSNNDLSIIKDLLELPACINFIAPSLPVNPWFLNSTAFVASILDVYLFWK